MNELQIRLSADISALQSALTKAKNTIKSFESETEKESEKGNVGFKRKIGLIEQLTNKAKSLRTALSQATNETQVAKYNAQLEETSRELSRLNALGRSVTANLGSTASGFGQVARQGANANGVAIEFNRVIQDAPFGLIGIGNNLQQLAGNFAQVSKQAGGTGKAIAASLSSIVSPVNLGLLAISALTAGFTAYQMGAFDSIFATESATESLEDYRETLDAVTRSLIEGESQGQKEIQSFQLLKSQAENANIPLKDRLEAVKDLKNQYPEYLQGLSDEQILTGNVGIAYENLTKQIIATAKARAASDVIAENSLKLLTIEERTAKRALDILKARDEFAKAQESVYDVGEIEIIKQINDLSQDQIDDINEINRINSQNLKLEEQINQQISEGARFTEAQKQNVSNVNQEAERLLRTYENIGTTLGSILERAALERRDAFFQGTEAPITAESGRATTQGIIIPEDVQSSVEDNLTKQINLVEELSGAYAGLGSLIGKAFDNPQFGNFIGQFAQFVTKVVAGAFAVSKANAVAGATQSSLFTGPAAAFTLPAFIAGAVGLVASAFAGIGGGGGSVGSAGSASVGAPPQIFTNSQIPSIPSSPAPSPSGNIDFDRAQGTLTTRVDGGDIVFVYDRYKERQQGGG